MSINSWNTITTNNYEDKVKDCQKHGPLRLKLAVHLVSILNKSGLAWFLDTGTLVGAFRDGKMLKHDDDFDIGILCAKKQFHDLYTQIKDYLIDSQYEIRLIQSYTTKLEVYDPNFDKYNFGPNNEYDYYNVTIDLQLYYQPDMSSTIVETTYTKDNYNKNTKFNINNIVPTSTIVYEGYIFNCPNKPKEYLETHYGYIGPNAIYNPKTMKYEKTKGTTLKN